MNRAEPSRIDPVGPLAHENWLRAKNGCLPNYAFECPLLSDAAIAGQIETGYGPYQFFNTVAPPGSLRPALVMRAEFHLEWNSEIDWSKTSTERYHGGSLQDELAALLSLSLGVRLKAGGCTRRFLPGGDPRGRPDVGFVEENPVLLKRSTTKPSLPYADHACLNDDRLLPALPRLSRVAACALVRAARLYQDALWISDSEPQLSWIMLASAIEAAAECWQAATASGRVGATKKFVAFLVKFRPPPRSPRCDTRAQIDWEDNSLFNKIYDLRSKALHRGTPFPLPMCGVGMHVGSGAYAERPVGDLSAMGAVWREKDTPMLLHTFEYIVRGCLCNWAHTEAGDTGS
jgi:hypothetical protein